ncbi:hypothetical protein C7E18_23370, partial [Stenotrophomonas maltophilia]
ALVLGVAVMTAVGTLVNRVNLALTGSAAEMLGGRSRLAGRDDPPQAFAALVLGVAVMTAVGTLVNRVNLALTGSAAEMLGG